MDRRTFLNGVLAGSFVALAAPGLANSGSRHPLARLTDVTDVVIGKAGAVARPFEANNGGFDIVIFMTQQRLYPECGGAFIGIDQTLERHKPLFDNVRPVIVFPKKSNQPDSSGGVNLDYARRDNDYADFTILTGDVDVIRDVSRAFQYERDGEGKRGPFIINGNIVDEHTLDAFLLTANGQVMVQHYAADFNTWPDLIERSMDACDSERNAQICYGL